MNDVVRGTENVLLSRSAIYLDRLEVDSLPPNSTTHCFVRLVEDGVGTPIAVPVVVVKGKKPGPTLGVTAALHGNELNGISIIHELLRKVSLRTLQGTLVCVIAANVPGLLNQRRTFSDGIDLNHIMPGDPKGKLSYVYAHRLLDRVTRDFDFLIDLHTASGGRVNSLYIRADLKQAMTGQMAYLCQPQIMVHNPASDYTLRGVFAEQKKPAITVEVCDPQRFQRDPIRRTLQGIRRILSHVGMTPKKADWNKMKPPILCRRSYWILADRGGMIQVAPRVARYVEKDELIATQVHIFGDKVREYTAPESGIVIGHAVNPLGQTGERILHLGVLMSEEEKKQFEETTGCSLQGVAQQKPGEQEVPSLEHP